MDTIGEQLKKSRLQRGLTIDDLEKITKIKRRYLIALEDNEFDTILDDYYTRTYIRQYAEAVGLNARPLIRQLDGYTRATPLQQGHIESSVTGSRKNIFKEKNAKQQKINTYLPLTLLTLMVLAIIGTIAYAIHLDTTNGPLVPNPEEVIILSSSSSDITISDSDSAESTDQSSEDSEEENDEMRFSASSNTSTSVVYDVKNVEFPISIELIPVNGNAWVGIRESGTDIAYFQSTVKLGEPTESIVPDGITSIDITVGAASNLNLLINGESVDFNAENPVDGIKNITFNFEEFGGTTSSSNSESIEE